jgi:BlaI family penicillinase repressor
MPKPRIRLSPGEWEIMQVLWSRKKAMSVRDVLQLIYPNSEKAYTTVQTVLNNLEQKGALRKEKIGLVNFYKATKPKKDAVRDETKSFVKRVFQGSFQDLANYLIESESLTPDDIDQLKQLIRDREEQQDAAK